MQISKLHVTPRALFYLICLFFTFSLVKFEMPVSHLSVCSLLSEPGKVTNLQAFDNSETSLKLNWTQPTGRYSNFMVMAANDSNFKYVFIYGKILVYL